MDESKCYRCSIDCIPEDQQKLKNSSIPLFFTVDFQKEGLHVPVFNEPLVRCDKCKAYLNPYVEVIMPGYKWKCNLCEHINTVELAFQMTERRVNEFPNDPIKNAQFNRDNFTREDLKSDIYEIEAPDTFTVKTTDSPILCFIIDVCLESQKLGIPGAALNCIKEVLKNIDYDSRTKVCFMFYDENCYILNNNNSLIVISGDIPIVLADKMLFSLPKASNPENSIENIDFAELEAKFAATSSNHSNILIPFKVAIQAFRSASIFNFISTMPNCGISALKPSQKLSCENIEYIQTANSLFKKNICVNQFIMARSNVEYSTLRILSQKTGGQTFHYSNFDGTDPVFSSKLFADLTVYFNLNIGFGAVCRIRANEGILLKNIYGNFTQKDGDLIGMSNYNPTHAINFSLLLFNNIKNALYVQIAMIRVTKLGKKLIRVMNICVPIRNQSLYSATNAYAICQALLLESLTQDLNKRENALQSSFTTIWREVRDKSTTIPENLYFLPQLILAAKKSIAVRPDNNTPTDFRSFYSYLFSNMNYRIFDLMLYPILINLNDSDVKPLPLSFSSITSNGLYILNTGISIFFYVGKNCDRGLYQELFGSVRSGPIIFNPGESEFSKYVIDMLAYLQQGCTIKPRYVLIDEQENTVYNDIFSSYMLNDRIYGLPDIETYGKEVNSIFN